MQKQEKPQGKRITECLNVLAKLEDELKIPKENPSIALLRKRMGTYWRDGKTQEGRIPLVNSNRNIVYKFPRWAHQEIEVLLRVSPLTFTELPADLAAELGLTSPPLLPSPEGAAESQTSSATQSGPSHPSLPE